MKTWHHREDGNGKGPTQTVHSKSSITDLSVGNRLFLARASAYLKSVYQEGDPQPTITPVEATIEGLVIDGVRFNVTIAADTVTNLATCHDFHHAAMHDKHFKDTQGKRLLSLWDGEDGRAAKGCFVYSLVGRIEWDGKLPKGADVSEDSHVIVWPDFGKIVLGEMLISHFNRRLTMMRLELGSPLEAQHGNRRRPNEHSRPAVIARRPLMLLLLMGAASCAPPADRAASAHDSIVADLERGDLPQAERRVRESGQEWQMRRGRRGTGGSAC